MDFIVGAAAACGATVFSNPLDVVKIRMQLQGELQKKSEHSIHYRNVFHASYVIAKNEGVLALNKGLVPALLVQALRNGPRLGLYQLADKKGYLTDANGKTMFYRNLIWSAIIGAVGQFLASPAFLIKTQLQSQAAESIAVGHQHHHKGTINAVLRIIKKNGIKGLLQGVGAAQPRAIFGSVMQLTSHRYTKQYLGSHEYFQSRPYLLSFCGSMVAGVFITLAATPLDLIQTRLYNQDVNAEGKGLLYRNFLDCARKVYIKEGIWAFYKGIGPMYFRIGPHNVMILVFWDTFTSLQRRYGL